MAQGSNVLHEIFGTQPRRPKGPAGTPTGGQIATAMAACARLGWRARVMAPDAPRPDGFLIDKHYFRKHGGGAYYGQK